MTLLLIAVQAKPWGHPSTAAGAGPHRTRPAFGSLAAIAAGERPDSTIPGIPPHFCREVPCARSPT